MSFEQNMKLQQIAIAKQQIAAELIKEKMQQQNFPKDKLPEGWLSIMKKALMKCPPISQKANLKEFALALRSIHNENSQISLSSFQIIANCLDAVAPDDLGLTQPQYDDLVNETIGLVETWTKLITKINEECIVQAEMEYKAKHESQSGGGILKPIKAQA